MNTTVVHSEAYYTRKPNRGGIIHVLSGLIHFSVPLTKVDALCQGWANIFYGGPH